MLEINVYGAHVIFSSCIINDGVCDVNDLEITILQNGAAVVHSTGEKIDDHHVLDSEYLGRTR